MAQYKTFSYASGTLYGYQDLGRLSPTLGASTGGESYRVEGSGFLVDGYNDDFTSVTLNPALWTDISSGTGSVSTGSTHLQLDTGSTAGSAAGIETLGPFASSQFGIRFVLPRITVYPDGEVTLLSYQLYVDASNYAEMAIVLGTGAATLKLKCSIYVDGGLRDYYEEAWTYGVATMRLLHYQSRVFFIANGSLIRLSKRFVNSTAHRRVFAYNGTSDYRIWNVTVEAFDGKTFVVFGDNVDYDAVTVSNYRIRGFTPPSTDIRDKEAAYAGPVTVRVVTVINTLSSAGGNDYAYYYLDKFRMFDSLQEGEKISIISDAQINSPVGKNGLGNGY